MTTLTETIQPSTAELDHLLPVALNGATVEEFIARYVTNLIGTLRENPLMYRAYGAWWFSLKKAIIESGYTGFGVLVDETVAATYRYEKQEHLLIASWLYMNDRIESGAIYSNVHLLPTAGEVANSDISYEFIIDDADMELLIRLKSAANK